MQSGHPEGRISLGELAQARKRLQESLGELHLEGASSQEIFSRATRDFRSHPHRHVRRWRDNGDNYPVCGFYVSADASGPRLGAALNPSPAEVSRGARSRVLYGRTSQCRKSAEPLPKQRRQTRASTEFRRSSKSVPNTSRSLLVFL